MNGIDYEKIRVKGFNIKSIKELVIKNEINNHAEIYITGIIDKKYADKYIDITGASRRIKVYVDNDSPKDIFNGVVTEIELNVRDEVYTIDIRGKSLSYTLDIEKVSRSFQDTSLTYHKIIKIILDKYDISYNISIPDLQIGELLIQYEETDYEFLRRIISKFNVAIFTDCFRERCSIYIGTPDNKKNLRNQISDYKIEKNLEEYEYMKENYIADAKETDYISYSIKTLELLSIGDNIDFLNHRFYVYKAKYEISQGILVNHYNLRVKSGVRVKNIYNSKVCGSSIDGKIIGVSGEKVQIHLAIDKVQDKSKAYWFKFSTMSASNDGSGWYCMPEIGDSVRVYFPSKLEAESFAVSAVSDYVCEDPSSEDMMGNPDNKYLKTANDKLVKLTPDGVSLSCDSGQADVKFNTDGSVSIVSKNNVSIMAQNNVELISEKKVKVKASESIYFGNDIGAGLQFDEEGQIKEIGCEVKNN